jgi:hypothetical protein
MNHLIRFCKGVCLGYCIVSGLTIWPMLGMVGQLAIGSAAAVVLYDYVNKLSNGQ